MTTRTQRWSWERWTQAVEASSLLTTADKALASRIRSACRGRVRWLTPWEIEGGPSFYDLYRLQVVGFMFRAVGTGLMRPILDPLPNPGSIEISRSSARLLRQMLAGRKLMRINIAGHVNCRTDRRRWALLPCAFAGYYSRIPVCASSIHALGRRGLIERDGTGHGWPTQYTSYYRVVKERLVGVRGFEAIGRRHIAEALKAKRREARS